MQRGSQQFSVSFGAEKVRFNERVLIGIMQIDGKPLLHIVDEGTKFSAVGFYLVFQLSNFARNY